MIYEILGATTFHSVNQNDIIELSKKNKKAYIEKVYNFFKENPTKASYCMALLGY